MENKIVNAVVKTYSIYDSSVNGLKGRKGKYIVSPRKRNRTDLDSDRIEEFNKSFRKSINFAPFGVGNNDGIYFSVNNEISPQDDVTYTIQEYEVVAFIGKPTVTWGDGVTTINMDDLVWFASELRFQLESIPGLRIDSINQIREDVTDDTQHESAIGVRVEVSVTA